MRVAYAAGVVSTAWANLTGTAPIVPLEGVKMARKKMFVTHDKASARTTVSPQVRWMQALDAPSIGFARTDTADDGHSLCCVRSV